MIVQYPDGTPFEGSGRYLLSRRSKKHGIWALPAGLGQHEIVYRPSGPVEAADHFMTFFNMVKTPLSDEQGHEFASAAAATTASGIVLIVRNEIADAIAVKAEPAEVLAVPNPLQKQVLFRTIN